MTDPPDIDALVVEIGSTTTVSAFSGCAEMTVGPRLLGQGTSLTTVGGTSHSVLPQPAATWNHMGPLEPSPSCYQFGSRLAAHDRTRPDRAHDGPSCARPH